MKENQLLRALRIDKMTLSALEATLELYLDEDEAIRSLPTLQMLSDKIENCLNRAQILAEKLKKSSNSKSLSKKIIVRLVVERIQKAYYLPMQ